MAESFNTARRLLNIFQEAQSLSPKNRDVVEGWGRVFGMGEIENHLSTEKEVGRLLSLVDDQLLLLADTLQRKGWDRDTFEDEIKNLRGVTRPRHFHRGDWGYVKERIADSSIKVLELGDQFLGDDYPEPVSEEELQELKDKLFSLRETISEGEYPQHLEEYLYDQIRSVERALRDYQILGFEAFDQAIYRAGKKEKEYQAEHTAPSETQEERTDEESVRNSLWEILSALASWADNAATVGKALNFAVWLIQVASGEPGVEVLPPSQSIPSEDNLA